IILGLTLCMLAMAHIMTSSTELGPRELLKSAFDTLKMRGISNLERQKAILLCRQALERAGEIPDYRTEIEAQQHLYIALALHDMGKYEEADAERILAEQKARDIPLSIELRFLMWNLLGMIHLSQKRYAEAVEQQTVLLDTIKRALAPAQERP